MKRSLSQPTIRHAMLALSPHLEGFAHNHRVRAFEAKQNAESLHHYGQALTCIRRTLNDEMNEERQIEILTAMFLVISLELVRSDGPAALAHLMGALRILSSSTMVFSLLADEKNTLLTALRALYVKLELHTLAYVGSWLPSTSVLGPDSMLDLEQYISAEGETSAARKVNLARHSFMCLKYRSYQVLRCDDVATTPGKPSSNGSQVHNFSIIETFLADLKSWFRLFQSVLESTIDRTHEPNSQDAKLGIECRILLIQYFLLSIRLSNAGEVARETTYDTLGESFDAIIQHAGAIVGTKQSCLFTLDLGIIEPLYYTVLKCREPEKRLRALRLLDSSAQEAAWDGPLMTNIAKCVLFHEAALHGWREDQPSVWTESTSKCMADYVWGFRDDPSAEMHRIRAVALRSSWGSRTAVVEAYHGGGTMEFSCAASSLPLYQA